MQKVPLIVCCPGFDKQKIGKTGGQIDIQYLYLNYQGSVYDINDGKLLPLNQFQKAIKGCQEELSISDLILQKDAYPEIINDGIL